MATLATLFKDGRLVKFDFELGPGEQPERYIHLTPELAGWIDGTLVYAPKGPGRDLTPYEQLEYLFTSFVRGDRMYHSTDFNKLRPQGDHVWEMKMTDVRVFGYFYRPKFFVGVCGNLAGTIKKQRHYEHYRKQVKAFRKRVPLDPPTYTPGGLNELT